MQGSLVLDDPESPNRVILAVEAARQDTAEDIEHQSKEIEDEVNQLDFDAVSLANPLSQVASNGNLNVQTLI